MTILDDVQSALRGLSANKLRSALTVLGILIGVGAVIILVAVGNGSDRAVQNRIKALGTNTITISNRGRFGRGPAAATGTQTQAATITQNDVQLMQDPTQAPDIASVSPVVSTSEDATYSGNEEAATVTGTTPAYFGAEDYSVASGRPITSSDVTNHTQVVVIGTELASDLFATGQDPIGQQIFLGSARFEVVGLLKSISATGLTDPNTVAIVPYTSAQDLLTGYTNNFTTIIVQAESAKTVDAAQNEASDILASANDTTVANLPFTILNESSLLSTSQSNNETFTVLLGAVAAISLLVGGIGVMNIMLVTVTERTREIGIRKAIGAPRRAILSQFLIEAVLLSLIGGIVGVVVGLIGTRFRIVGVQPVASTSSVFLAFGVAVAVGVFFGFYPANRAAGLRPVDALRYE